jgi:hypothetical protein
MMDAGQRDPIFILLDEYLVLHGQRNGRLGDKSLCLCSSDWLDVDFLALLANGAPATSVVEIQQMNKWAASEETVQTAGSRSARLAMQLSHGWKEKNLARSDNQQMNLLRVIAGLGI